MRFSLIRILPLTTEYNALVENPILDFEGEYFLYLKKYFLLEIRVLNYNKVAFWYSLEQYKKTITDLLKSVTNFFTC